MELDRLTEEETQTAMDAIAKIVPVLELQDCLQIVQWATERAAVVNQPSLSLVTEAPELPVVDFRLDDEESLSAPELAIVPPLTESPSADSFLIPTLELVGEPPEDLPIAI